MFIIFVCQKYFYVSTECFQVFQERCFKTDAFLGYTFLTCFNSPARTVRESLPGLSYFFGSGSDAGPDF